MMQTITIRPFRQPAHSLTAWHKDNTGFSLVEMAVVMVILGLLLGALILPFSTQRDLQKRNEAEQILEEARNALFGFAAINGRLPCPATNASNGLEALTGSDCSTEHGFLPTRALGLNGTVDTDNLLQDPWLNPIRYSLDDTATTWEYAKRILVTSATPTYRICQESACGTNPPIAENIVAVVFSTGADGTATTSPDQRENTDNDTDFVTRVRTEGAGTEFDDVLVWVSPNTLILHLVRSGQLDGT